MSPTVQQQVQKNKLTGKCAPCTYRSNVPADFMIDVTGLVMVCTRIMGLSHAARVIEHIQEKAMSLIVVSNVLDLLYMLTWNWREIARAC